jgi:hypothetical protein
MMEETIIYSDVRVNIKKGSLTLPINCIKYSGDLIFDNSNNNSFIELKVFRRNNMYSKNYFELTPEIKEWFDSNCRYEIYQFFRAGIIYRVFLKKIESIY